MPPVRVVAPEGGATEIDDRDLQPFLDAGYTVESGEQAIERVAGQAAEEQYGGLGGTIEAGAYGLARGLTLGLSDAILAGDDPVALRKLREVNRGVSIGTEILGGVAPAILSGGTGAVGTAARLTPSGLLSAGALGATERIAAGGGVGRYIAGAAAGGALEGAVQNVGSYISDIALENRELSAEGFLASAGQGALWGGAAGGALAGVERGTIAARRLFPRSQVGNREAIQIADETFAARGKDLLRDADDLEKAARDVVGDLRVRDAELKLERERLRVGGAKDAAAKIRLKEIDVERARLAAQRKAMRDAKNAERAARGEPDLPEEPPPPTPPLDEASVVPRGPPAPGDPGTAGGVSKLDEAIARHERHLTGAEPTDEASQRQMMAEMKAARDEIAGGGPARSAAPSSLEQQLLATKEGLDAGIPLGTLSGSPLSPDPEDLALAARQVDHESGMLADGAVRGSADHLARIESAVEEYAEKKAIAAPFLDPARKAAVSDWLAGMPKPKYSYSSSFTGQKVAGGAPVRTDATRIMRDDDVPQGSVYDRVWAGMGRDVEPPVTAGAQPPPVAAADRTAPAETGAGLTRRDRFEGLLSERDRLNGPAHPDAPGGMEFDAWLAATQKNGEDIRSLPPDDLERLLEYDEVRKVSFRGKDGQDVSIVAGDIAAVEKGKPTLDSQGQIAVTVRLNDGTSIETFLAKSDANELVKKVEAARTAPGLDDPVRVDDAPASQLPRGIEGLRAKREPVDGLVREVNVKTLEKDVAVDGEKIVSITADRSGRPSDGRFIATVTMDDGSTIQTMAMRRDALSKLMEDAAPPAFRPGGAADATAGLRRGLPETTEDIVPNAMYVFKPSEIAERTVRGDEIRPKDLESVRQGFKDGKKLHAIEVHMTPDGTLWVADGNHRLQASALTNQPVAATIKRISEPPTWGKEDLAARIKADLPPAAPAPALGPRKAGADLDAEYDRLVEQAALADGPEALKEIAKQAGEVEDEIFDRVQARGGKDAEQVARIRADRAKYNWTSADVAARRAEKLAMAEPGMPPLSARASAEAGDIAAFERTMRQNQFGSGQTAGAAARALTTPAGRVVDDAVPFDVGNIKLRIKVSTKKNIAGQDVTEVKAYRTLGDGEEVVAANAEFRHRGSGDLFPDNVQVPAGMQRKGVASKMYELAEARTGRRILPSETQTEAGAALSRSYRARRDAAGKNQAPRSIADDILESTADVAAAPSRFGIGRFIDDANAAIKAIGDMEAAHHKLVAELGPAAPPAAQARAAEYAAALDDQARKGTAAIAASADDAARAASLVALPKGDTAAAAVAGARKDATSRAADVAGALELLRSVGDIPYVPDPASIPVLGPVLSMYLKYRGAKAVFHRLGGRIGATAEAKVAARSAELRDKAAGVVDALLAQAPKVARAARKPTVVAGAKLIDALRHPLYADGEERKEAKTAAEATKHRVAELGRAAADPEGVKRTIRRQVGVTDPDLAAAIEAATMRKLSYLQRHAPRQPPPGLLGAKPWTPAPAEIERFARRVRAAEDPVSVLEDVENGTVTPEAADALRAVYPQIFAEVQTRLLTRAAEIEAKLPYRRVVQLSLIFNVPLDDSLRPENLLLLQEAPGSPSAQAGPGSTAAGPAGQPPMPSVAGPLNVARLYETPEMRRASRR